MEIEVCRLKRGHVIIRPVTHRHTHTYTKAQLQANIPPGREINVISRLL